MKTKEYRWLTYAATELYSQTKLITCTAALQLVDRGLVSLDSEEDVRKLLPEIGSLAILKGYNPEDKPVLVKPTRTVTLRMLMSHSAGGLSSCPQR
jgi:CubicO group peptidase (beta-lactamase class C family)